MRTIFIIFLILIFLNNKSLSDEYQRDNYSLLNEKQKSLYYASRNCDSTTIECLDTILRFNKEVQADKQLYNTEYLGWSTYWYGSFLSDNNKLDEALEIWEQMISQDIFAEKQNDEFRIYALIALGWVYFTEVDYLDDKKSFRYMKEAADYGNSWALNNLGVFYHMGRNTKKNMSKAFESYKKAAELRNHWAHGNLADFYLFGWGGADRNFQKSVFEMKFSTISTHTTNNNFKLKCLLNYNMLPIDEDEFVNWMKNYLIKTKDPNGFQEIAWLISETNNNNVEEEYKWQYLTSIFVTNIDIKNRALQELQILKARNKLSNEKVSEIKKKAQKWINTNWN